MRNPRPFPRSSSSSRYFPETEGVLFSREISARWFFWLPSAPTTVSKQVAPTLTWLAKTSVLYAYTFSGLSSVAIRTQALSKLMVNRSTSPSDRIVMEEAKSTAPSKVWSVDDGFSSRMGASSLSRTLLNAAVARSSKVGSVMTRNRSFFLKQGSLWGE
ncbi:hypothetical protein FB451DRAFT_1232857 [Mycena latifolia]|nr:hypothetical protein FB451DRAFT_1232857 [Mycena latifolia]